MGDRCDLPAGVSAPLRARFDRLTAAQQTLVLERLADSRRRRATGRFALTTLAPGPTGSALPPLVILPSMFGTVDDWRELVAAEALGRAVFGVEVRGPDAYWTPSPTFEAIAAAAVAVLRERWPDQRVHLGGYSFGGRLAYEVARQLTDSGEPPLAIVVLDASARQASRRLTWRDLGPIAANAGPWLVNELRHYGPRDLALRLSRRWRFRAGAADDGRDARLNQVFDLARFPAVFQERLRQSQRAAAAYRPGPSPHHVFYLRSRVRPLARASQPDGGWGAVVSPDRLTVVDVPSDHGSALHARWHQTLRSTLRAALAAADDLGAPPPGR